jgi:hypothetical protein
MEESHIIGNISEEVLAIEDDIVESLFDSEISEDCVLPKDVLPQDDLAQDTKTAVDEVVEQDIKPATDEDTPPGDEMQQDIESDQEEDTQQNVEPTQDDESEQEIETTGEQESDSRRARAMKKLKSTRKRIASFIGPKAHLLWGKMKIAHKVVKEHLAEEYA